MNQQVRQADFDAAEVFGQAKEAALAGRLNTYGARRDALLAFKRMAEDGEAIMAEAIALDMGRSANEAWTSELTTLQGEIDHALANLKSWMKPAEASVPFILKPARAAIRWEPKGVVLVIGAWNLPFAVTLAPAVAAIAAGNAVVCKPSELAPASAMAMRELVAGYFPPSVMQVVEGDAQVTQSLLEHRWDHVFFTGGAGGGHKIAQAAARFGTPTTLELGGKCPAYVHASANLRVAARRIVWGKFMNAGQVCVAPDYAIVDRAVASDFAAELIEAIGRFYGDDPGRSKDFGRIVNDRQFDRIAAMLHATGGEIIAGGRRDADRRYIAPTVVMGVGLQDALMREEIFGPVLPVLTVEGPAQAAQTIASLDAPLATYPFASDKAVLARFENETRTGAVVSNDVTVNHAVRSLPFGGVGGSGHGVYHGVHGFRTFSYPKALLRRDTRFDPDLRYPPYTETKMKWLRRLG